MLQDKSKQNISLFYSLLIPIIIAAKIVRWTIMYPQLIGMSIGWAMVGRVNLGWITPFHATIMSQFSSGSGVAQTNAEALMDMINVFGFSTYVQWEVFFTIIFNIVLVIFIIDFYKNNKGAGFRENLFIYFGVATLNIFCLNPAKEPYQLLFFILLYWCIKKPKGFTLKYISVYIGIFITVLYCRKYYGLVGIFLFVIQIVIKRFFYNIDYSSKYGKLKLAQNIFFTVIIIAFFHYFFMTFLADRSESTYDEMVAVNNRDQNRASVATSEIIPLFNSTNQLSITLEFLTKIFRLLFPIELLILGKTTYLFFIVNQILLIFFIVRSLKNQNAKNLELTEEEDGEEVQNCEVNEIYTLELNEEEEEEYDCEQNKLDNKEYVIQQSEDQINNRTIATYLYISFLLASAAFEPDFGSWIRHQSVAFPIILLIL